MNSLPLSWSIIDQNNTVPINNRIKLWNLNWIAFQQINKVDDLENKLNNELLNDKQKFLIRGCNMKQSNKLNKMGFSSFQFGMEAIIKINNDPFRKKSLRELVKRGLRHGNVKLIPYSDSNKSKLDAFKNKSRHGDFTQLQNLFQTDFSELTKLYVFVKDNNEWLGAILLSNNSKKKLHTELILKKKDSPAGIMEALISRIFLDARENNIYELSLGEVPFIFKSGANLFVKLIERLSILLKFAYNYRGLYNFKNKFQPHWEPLYICSNSKNKLLDLLLIFHRSNFSKLFFQKLVYNLKS